MKLTKLKKKLKEDAGFAMVAAMVVILVLGVSAGGMFTMAQYETKSSNYRTASMQAFYLAEAAIERGKARLAGDSDWRDGWSEVELGTGVYSLSLQDTTYMGGNVVRLLATGQVENAFRKIEAMVEMGGGGWDHILIVQGDLNAKGNLCMDGHAHICGNADFGNHDEHLHCGGTYTEGFELDPPTLFTEPDKYPDATYYYVRGDYDGHDYKAAIFDRYGNDITGSLGDDLSSVISYGSGTFTYYFSKHVIDHYFHDSSGVFSRNSGDQAVVINFGEEPLYTPSGSTRVSNVVIQGNGHIIHPTIFNTRFLGGSDSQRLDSAFWTGGGFETKKIVFEPYQGISLAAHDFQQAAGALSQVGTSNWPGVTYVTNDVVKVRANFVLEGAIIVLGDWHNTGGPDLLFNSGFADYLPDYFLEPQYMGGSGGGGTMVVSWHEVASGI